MAARCERMKVVAHLSAEICPFANAVAKKNFGDDDARAGFSATRIDDVTDITGEVIDSYGDLYIQLEYSSQSRHHGRGLPLQGNISVPGHRPRL